MIILILSYVFVLVRDVDEHRGHRPQDGLACQRYNIIDIVMLYYTISYYIRLYNIMCSIHTNINNNNNNNIWVALLV